MIKDQPVVDMFARYPGRLAFTYAPPQAPLDVVFADDDLLVFNKPCGLLTVAGKHADHADCLERRAAQAYSGARIIHRLDMDTSGLIVLARNSDVHRHVSRQFELRQVHKEYRARIWGRLEQTTGQIDLPLRCDWPNRPLQMVDFEAGKPAQTTWQIISAGVEHSDILLMPKTGRSHQLRVHLSAFGHPILGDKFYAHDAALAMSERLCLHASKLGFEHPVSGAMLTFESPSPF